MDNISQLMIRACKGKNSKERLIKLYYRFYLKEVSEDLAISVIISNLCEIVDKYCPIGSHWLYSEITSREVYGWITDDRTIKQKMLDTMISHIANTKAVKFEGLTEPLYFRKRGEK